MTELTSCSSASSHTDAVIHARPVLTFPAGLQSVGRNWSVHEEVGRWGEQIFFFLISMKPELHQLSCMTSTWTIDQRWLCNLPIKTELMLRSSTNTRAEVSPEVQSVFVYSSLTLWTLSVTVYEEFILYYYFCLNFPLFGLIVSWISWWSTQPWRRGKWSTNTPPFSRGWVHTF